MLKGLKAWRGSNWSLDNEFRFVKIHSGVEKEAFTSWTDGCQQSTSEHCQKPVSCAGYKLHNVARDKMHVHINVQGHLTLEQVTLGLDIFQNAKKCLVAGMQMSSLGHKDMPLRPTTLQSIRKCYKTPLKVKKHSWEVILAFWDCNCDAGQSVLVPAFATQVWMQNIEAYCLLSQLICEADVSFWGIIHAKDHTSK